MLLANLLFLCFNLYLIKNDFFAIATMFVILMPELNGCLFQNATQFNKKCIVEEMRKNTGKMLPTLNSKNSQ